MCRDDTMMRMSGIEDRLLGMLEEEASRGLGAVDAAEMGEVVDMVKDLAEAKYYCSIVKAMEADDPMGYNPSRYASGRYAPKGRGMGYDGMMGYEDPEPRMGGAPRAYEEMGGPMRNGASQGARNGYGMAYDRYQEARIGYQRQSTADNRRMMEQTADEHMQEFEDSLREIWDDADQRQRNKIKAALVTMANGLK